MTGRRAALPRALASYPNPGTDSIAYVLAERVHLEPFNAIATAIFLLAILHTFAAARFSSVRTTCSTPRRARASPGDAGKSEPRRRGAALPRRGGGDIRPLGGRPAGGRHRLRGWETATHYFNDTVNYTEPLFVVVIMALASTRPIIGFAEAALRRVAQRWAAARRPPGG